MVPALELCSVANSIAGENNAQGAHPTCSSVATNFVHSDGDRLHCSATDFIVRRHSALLPHSTVTLFARLRGLSTSVPRAQAV